MCVYMFNLNIIKLIFTWYHRSWPQETLDVRCIKIFWYLWTFFFANQHISWHVRKLGSSPALINCSEASDRRLSARDGRLFIGNYKHYHLTLSLPLLSCSSPSRQKSNYPNARRTQFNVITHQGCCGIGRNTTCCRSMEESTSLGTVSFEAACRSSTDSRGACARRFKSAAHGDDGEK